MDNNLNGMKSENCLSCSNTDDDNDSDDDSVDEDSLTNLTDNHINHETPPFENFQMELALQVRVFK
jgi:hypothetical protein